MGRPGCEEVFVSGFKIILVGLTVVIGVVRLCRGRAAAPGQTADAETLTDEPERCRHCGAEIEPGFMECWKCGKSLNPDDPDGETG